MSVICEFCNKSFSTVSSKNHHQKTAKSCISSQKERMINPTQSRSFNCSGCGTNFYNKFCLSRHESTCAVKVNVEKIQELETMLRMITAENQTLKDTNKRLHQSLDAISCKLASKTNTVYKNCTINQLIINKELAPYTLTPAIIEQIVDEKFEAKHLHLKTSGLAKFAIDNVIRAEDGRPQMVCTDPSRKTFIYKDANGNLYRDAAASEFSDQYLSALEKKGSKIMDQISTTDTEAIRQTITGISKIQDLKENNSSLTGELAKKLALKSAGLVEENP